MAKHLGFRFLAGASAVVLAACLSASIAQAGFVSQLEGMQLADGAVNQWRFEGGDAADRQKDRTNHLHLNSIAGVGGTGSVDPDLTPGTGDEYTYDYTPAATGFNAGSIIYEAGYDGAGVSQSYRPRGMAVTSTNAAELLSQRRAGAGLYGSIFQSSAMMTFEGVIRPDQYDDQTNTIHYVLQTRPSGGRGYFLAQQLPDASRGAGGSMVAAIGSTFGTQAGRPRIIKDYSDADHWYYVAITYDFSAGAGGPAVLNSWYADLTAGGPLIKSLTNATTEGTVGASFLTTKAPLGVGMFANAVAAVPPIPNTTVINLAQPAQEFFRGSIDNLAIYGQKLTVGDIERHHRALTTVGVPEPATVALLALGSLAFAALRRKVG